MGWITSYNNWDEALAVEAKDDGSVGSLGPACPHIRDMSPYDTFSRDCTRWLKYALPINMMKKRILSCILYTILSCIQFYMLLFIYF